MNSDEVKTNSTETDGYNSTSISNLGNIDNQENVSTGHISLQQVAHSQEGNIPTNSSNPIIEQNESIEIVNTGQISNMNNLKNPNSQKKYLTDSEMLYAFIGTNYQKFIMGKFNFPAFFLSAIYLLYRKMRFYSFIVTVLYVITSIFIKNPLYLSGIFLTINFILGLCVNKLYIRHCRNKIDNIRYKFSFFENEELLQKCKENGGTSILSIILGLLVNFIIIVIIIGLYLYFIVKIPVSDIYKKIMDYFVDSNGFSGMFK